MPFGKACAQRVSMPNLSASSPNSNHCWIGMTGLTASGASGDAPRSYSLPKSAITCAWLTAYSSKPIQSASNRKSKMAKPHKPVSVQF